jgi:glucose-fructose oxidoreductase
LIYFSDCIRSERRPEPDGQEGLADVKIIEALYASAKSGQVVPLDLPPRSERPSLSQGREAPPVREPELVHAQPPQAEVSA